MNNKFDEMTKGLAQSVTRRQALQRFGKGIASVVLALLGAGKAAAQTATSTCCFYCTRWAGYGRTRHCVMTQNICEPPGIACPAFLQHGRNQYPLINATAVTDCALCK